MLSQDISFSSVSRIGSGILEMPEKSLMEGSKRAVSNCRKRNAGASGKSEKNCSLRVPLQAKTDDFSHFGSSWDFLTDGECTKLLLACNGTRNRHHNYTKLPYIGRQYSFIRRKNQYSLLYQSSNAKHQIND